MALDEEIKKQKAKNRILKNKGKPQKVYNLVKDYNENDGKPKGNPTCICSRCKKEFEQDYVPDRNAYTDWKTCKGCRDLLREEKTKSVLKNEKEVSVAKLPYTPYAWQIEAQKAFEDHRFIVLACGNRCFLKGDFINGADKFVEDLTEDDLVIGSNGQLQEIVQISTMPYSGYVYTIKGVGMEPIRVSCQHPIWIESINKNKKGLHTGEFIDAVNLKEYIENMGEEYKPYLKIPRIKGEVDCNSWEFIPYEKNRKNQFLKMELNEDTSWMLGLYCAEGCYLGSPGCKWTLNYKEPELAEKLCCIFDSLGLHYNVRERENEGTRCVIITKSQFNRKLDSEIGHGALNKKIPSSILYNNNEKILISFLKGYYDGDGSIDNKNIVMRSTTVSKTLSQQLQTAWARLGYFSKITSMQRNRKRIKKNGEVGICSKEYQITLNEPEAIRLLGYKTENKIDKNNKKYIIENDAIYTQLNYVVEEKTEELIYAISTEDETITCFNTLTHNSGKDRFTIMAGIQYFVQCLNENRAIDNPDMVPAVLWWQIAPTEKMAKQNWRELKQYFPKEWIVACSDSSYQMETVGGGIVEVRSGYSADDLVGVGLDLVTITEAARFKDLNLAWANLEARLNSPGRGRIKDRAGRKYGQGKAIINSSPLGKNSFYDLFCFGQKDHPNYSSLWWSAQYPWTCNPVNAELANSLVQTRYGTLRYEETLRRQIGEQAFRSNYLADFLAEDGTVFRDFEEKCVINVFDPELQLNTKAKRKEFIENWQKVEPGAHYCGGYDPSPGTVGDSPTFVIRNMDNNRVVRIFDLMGKQYEQQWDFIADVCKQYNFAPVYWLRTGHTPIENQFVKRGLTEVPIDEQGSHKQQLVQNLEIAVENRDLQILMDGSGEAQTLIYQMNDYMGTKTKSGNIQYSNDKQKHDDWVSALYAAFSDYSAFEEKVGYCGLFGSL